MHAAHWTPPHLDVNATASSIRLSPAPARPMAPRRTRSAAAFAAALAPRLPRARVCARVSRRAAPVCCARAPKVSRAGDAAGGAGFGHLVTVDEMTQAMQADEDPIWRLMRREAETAAAAEPQLASSLYSSVLVHGTLEETLATVLGNALDTATFQATQWVELFLDAMEADPEYGTAIRADITAVMERDPANGYAAGVMLYAKGFHALESWRLAHWLWVNGRHSLALYLQSMISSRFAVDIHPAATIGSGVLLDHGTGIVIGETATLGNNVSLLHNVTLGGTGKEKGDRHPKVGDGVMIGAGAAILGNIRVGEGAHIAACSVVLKAVEPFSIISGVPGKVVGKLVAEAGVMPSFAMDQRLSIKVLGGANPYQDVVTGSVKGKPGHDSSSDEVVFSGGDI